MTIFVLTFITNDRVELFSRFFSLVIVYSIFNYCSVTAIYFCFLNVITLYLVITAKCSVVVVI